MVAKLKKGRYNPDPVFQAEMAAIEEERRRAFAGDFPERWAERMKTPAEPIYPSKLHIHTGKCFKSEPYAIRDLAVWFVGHRCELVGSFVTILSFNYNEGKRLGLEAGRPLPEAVRAML